MELIDYAYSPIKESIIQNQRMVNPINKLIKIKGKRLLKNDNDYVKIKRNKNIKK